MSLVGAGIGLGPLGAVCGADAWWRGLLGFLVGSVFGALAVAGEFTSCSNSDMAAKAKVNPFLMFEGKAEEAMKFYVSLFPASEVTDVVRYGPGQAGPEGSIMKAAFTVGGETILCTDSFVTHEFTFTPAISFFVNCESENEVERLANALSVDGSILMPLGDYGFSRKFAWVSDRYGVSWQLNLD